MNGNQLADELLVLLKDELDQLQDHMRREKITDDEDDEYIDSSWIYDMYRATDALNREVPWEQILKMLLEFRQQYEH